MDVSKTSPTSPRNRELKANASHVNKNVAIVVSG